MKNDIKLAIIKHRITKNEHCYYFSYWGGCLRYL